MKRSWLKGFVVVAVVVGSAMFSWRAIAADRDQPFVASQGVYSGTSDSGSFEEALQNAIFAAHQGECPGCSDHLLQWELVSMKGREGGFAYTNELTVTIKAQ